VTMWFNGGHMILELSTIVALYLAHCYQFTHRVSL